MIHEAPLVRASERARRAASVRLWAEFVDPVDRLPERLHQRRRHPSEPGIKGEELEPLGERSAAVVLSSLVT